ncbi:MAG: DMT family transporter [Amylibacter sp.]|jgi:drug/metabolite transporter (DMT)-like permease|tara:strand:+ start:4762 stop:5712 length:951 start_codon:yes stop_codon:yes gene_type:complete
MQIKSNGKAACYSLCAFAIYATHDVFIKILGADYSSFQIVFFNVLFGMPLVTLIMIQDSKPGTLLPVHPIWSGIRTVATMMTGLLAFYSFSVLPLAQVYSILFAMPLLITVLAIPILGEKVGCHRWLAVIAGLVGVLIVLRPDNVQLEFGHLAALGAAFSGAMASVIMRKIGKEERLVVLMIYPMIVTFFFMGIALQFNYTPMPIEDLRISFLIAVLGLVATLFVIAAYRLGEAAVVAPMQYSQIIWASIYGYFLFNEQINKSVIIGTTIIIASGLYIVLRESGSSSANTPVLRTRSREMGSGLRVGAMLRAIGRR